MAKLNSIEDLLSLEMGDTISASDRYKLFTGKKIGNTPQKGINWLGDYRKPALIVLRSRTSSGYTDRWIDESSGIYLYYFMIEKRSTNNARINFESKENLVLLNQRNHNSPILLTLDLPGSPKHLRVLGRFDVITFCHDNPNYDFMDSVLLKRRE